MVAKGVGLLARHEQRALLCFVAFPKFEHFSGSPLTITTSEILFASRSEVGKSTNPLTKKKRVAIVEDEQGLIEIYSAYLENLGYNLVFSVASGEELVQTISSGLIAADVVIMDYRLPGIDGIETSRRILALSPEMKIILTTADDSVRKRAGSLGVSFLQKPFSMSILARMIDEI